MQNRAVLLLGISVMPIMLASAAVAQPAGDAADTPPAAAEPVSAAAPPQLPAADAAAGEIVVTAQRRQESIQRVGASITAISGEQLQSARIEQAVDISKLTAGLSTINRSGDSAPTFAVRGIGLDDFNPISTSGTAIYLDGVYQSGPVFLSAPLFDVARVEVLKGPQGTLYGKNATGGAINIISNAPTEETEGYVTLGYSRWDTVDFRAALSGALGGGFSGRLAAYVTHQGKGFQRDVDTGRRYGATRQYAGRALLQYEQDDLTVLLNLHASQDSSVPSSYNHDLTDFPGCVDCAPELDIVPFRPGRVRVGLLDMKRDETIYGASLTATYQFGFADLVTVLSYDKTDHFNVDNNDGVPQALYDYVQDDDVQQAYIESRLASSAPLLDRVSWIVGASYSWQKFHSRDFTDQSFGFIGSHLSPVDFSFVRGLSVAQNDVTQTPTSFGVFLSTTTRLTDGFRLVLGGRFSHDRVEAVGRTTEEGLVDGGVLFQGVGATVVAIDDARTSNKWVYKVGVEYDVAPRTLFYASISSGTKSGTFYLGPASDPASWRYVAPEEIISYEAGLKSGLFGNRLTLNGSAFYYDYRDRQASVAFQSDFTGLFATSLDNIPKSRVQGFELEASVRPLKGLTLNGAVTHLDTSIRRTLADVDGQPLLVPVPVGSPLAQSPRWSYVLGGSYERQLTDALKGRLSANYVRSTKQIDFVGDPFGEFGPNSELSGRLELSWDDAWEVAVWGRNLTDNRDRTLSYVNLIGRTFYVRRPISVGVQVTRRF